MEVQILSFKPVGQNFNQFYPKDLALMSEIKTVLVKHNASKRFGVSLLQEDFEIAPDEVLIETTDIMVRTQKIMPYNLSHEINSREAINTSWRLDTGNPVMACRCLTGTAESGHQHYPIN